MTNGMRHSRNASVELSIYSESLCSMTGDGDVRFMARRPSCSPSAVVKFDSSYGMTTAAVSCRPCVKHGLTCRTANVTNYIMMVENKNAAFELVVFIDGKKLPKQFFIAPHIGRKKPAFAASLFKRQPLADGTGFAPVHTLSTCTSPRRRSGATTGCEDYSARLTPTSNPFHRLTVTVSRSAFHQVTVNWSPHRITPQRWLVSLTRLDAQRRSSATCCFWSMENVQAWKFLWS
jgi:hypothetical protein